MTQPVTRKLCPKCDAPVTSGYGVSGVFVYCENPRCDFFEKASQPTEEPNGKPANAGSTESDK
jgi:hypothetical protein